MIFVELSVVTAFALLFSSFTNPILAAVAESPAEVVSVWPRRESLEDLFMKEVARER
jgi:hypothetical protein